MLNDYIFPNIWFTITLTLLFLYTTFLTARGTLTDERFKKNWWRKINGRGRKVLYTNILIIFILFFQYKNNLNWESKKNSELKKEQSIRDSIIRTGIQSGVNDANNKLFDNISKSFANQNLKIDTLSGTIIRLNYPKNITNNFIEDKDPILTISTINGIFLYEKTNPPYFRVNVQSINSGSTNFNIDSYILTYYSEGSPHLSKKDLFPKNAKIITKASIPLPKMDPQKVKSIFLYLKGTYTNLSNTKSYSIDDLFHYNHATSKTMGLTGHERDDIIKVINKNYPISN